MAWGQPVSGVPSLSPSGSKKMPLADRVVFSAQGMQQIGEGRVWILSLQFLQGRENGFEGEGLITEGLKECGEECLILVRIGGGRHGDSRWQPVRLDRLPYTYHSFTPGGVIFYRGAPRNLSGIFLFSHKR